MSFVTAAESIENGTDSVITNHRIALQTGLSRKEVGRLKSLLDDPEYIYDSPSRAQTIINGWLKDKEYLKPDKTPLTLPLKNKVREVEKCSFKGLVKRYGRDLSYSEVLVQLSSKKIIECSSDGFVTLKKHSIPPPKKSDVELIKTLAESISPTIEHLISG